MFIAMLFNENTRWIGATVLGSTILLFGGMMCWVARSENKKAAAHRSLLESARRTTQKLVAAHLDTLANQLDVLVRADRYGVVHAQDWNKEVQHFADKVIRPSLTVEEAAAVAEFGMNEFSQSYRGLRRPPLRDATNP